MGLSVRFFMDFSGKLVKPRLGAGHPGEDDIGGLVLVCACRNIGEPCL